MKFRIYRLPGSHEWWHIDSGAGTEVINVTNWRCGVDSESINVGGENVPRSWIEISEPVDLHIINGIAYFSYPLPKGFTEPPQVMKTNEANMSREGTGKAEI